MPKQKQQTRMTMKISDDFDDDTLSTTSSNFASTSSDLTMNTNHNEPDNEPDEESLFEDYIDSLFEKRSSTREAGLKGLCRAFTERVMTDFVEEKHETLTHQFLNCVKRGSATEIILACHALGMLAVIAGAGTIAEQVLQQAYPPLLKLLKTGSTDQARISAIEALAILTFVGAVEINATIDAMEAFWQICSHKGNVHSDQTFGMTKPSSAVKAAAMSAWTFLLSTLTSHQIAGQQLSQKLPIFLSLLEIQDLGLRKATGEAVVLLYELTDGLLFEEAGEGKEAELVEQIRELAIDASRQGQNKKEKAEQRSSFREMLAVIEDGGCKETSLKLQYGDTLRINTWSQTLQLNALRRFLAEGFQRHMQENVLLHEIFNYTPRNSKLPAQSAKEKRLNLSRNSAASKLRTQEMNRRRSQGRKYM